MEKQQRKTISELVEATVKLDESAHKIKNIKELLSEISFDKVNIQLTIKREDLGLSGKGYVNIGYVNSFDTETERFKIVIFKNHADKLEGFKNLLVNTLSKDYVASKVTKFVLSVK